MEVAEVRKNISALVVDDDRFMIKLTTRVLEQLEIEDVRSASEGEEAMIELRAREADLIICDLQMPGMDGIEFMRHLAERDHQPAFILLSGVGKRILQTASQLADARNLNLLGVIEKPVSKEKLEDLLDRFDQAKKPTSSGAGGESLRISEIKKCIGEDRVTPVFQPKVSMKDGHVVGVEALARWQKDDGQLLPAGAFIPAAEQGGLMDAITDAMLRKTIAEAAVWLMDGYEFSASINVAADNLVRLDFPEYLEEIAFAEGLSLDRLTLELTETGIMKDILAPMEILSRLRMKGIGLAIDDFGTGYSSMQQLKRMPFTELKIDRAFVCGAENDSEAMAMLESSLLLARELDLYVVAEGAETQSDWDILEKLGVDAVQGYFVAKPMPVAELLAFVDGRK